MKIYVLGMLISVIVGFSYIPRRNQATEPAEGKAAAPDSVPASA